MDPLLLCGIFVRVSFRYLYTVCASWETFGNKKAFSRARQILIFIVSVFMNACFVL